MDLPEDIWAIVRRFISPKEWEAACGTHPASYVLKRLLLAGEVHCKQSDSERGLLRQLDLDMWPTCHTLCLDLWRLHEAMKATPAQVHRINLEGTALPLLQCLRVTGRDQVPDAESNALGMLRSILVRSAPILTTHFWLAEVPLELPALRHIVLDIGTTWAEVLRHTFGWCDFPVASLLRSLMAVKLESLYVRCPGLTISGPRILQLLSVCGAS